MGRGCGGLILVLVELCLFMALIAENTRAYPYRMDRNASNADQFLSTVPKPKMNADGGRWFSQSSEESQMRNDDKELVGSNGRRNGRYPRFASTLLSKQSKPFVRSFIDSSGDDMQSDGKIIFPGEEIRPLPVPRCKGDTYCENVVSYPKDLVNNAIRVNDSLKYLAAVDVVPSIIHRIDAMDDVPLCVSTEHVIFPQTAENKDNQWKYIANQENFKQGVRIEKCSKENVSCSMIASAAEGYKTSCKQKYVYRQLASVLSDGKVVPDTFRFPSSCCCHATFSGNAYTRFGDDRSQVTPVKTRRRK